MPRPRPPFLQKRLSRHGEMCWYVRRGRGKFLRIRGEYGSEAFWEAYHAAVKGSPAVPKEPKSGSLQWLYDNYRQSTAWSDLSPATRDQRENIFEHVMADAGHIPFRLITQQHIADGRDRRRETPSQARNFLDAVRGMFRWALEARHIKFDPTAGVRNPKKKATDGFKAWDMDDVARYEARWPAGTKERVWMHVLLYIGARRGDAVTLGRQHAKNGVISFTTEKGRTKRRIVVTRVIEPELAATLAQGPTGDLSFIAGENGKPLVKESFGNLFKAACVAAGIRGKSAHGLRKLSAIIWVERGATEHELMAMFGWMTPAMAALYTREAHRAKMTINAYSRLMGGGPQKNTVRP
jgi:integrase